MQYIVTRDALDSEWYIKPRPSILPPSDRLAYVGSNWAVANNAMKAVRRGSCVDNVRALYSDPEPPATRTTRADDGQSKLF